MVRFCLEVLFHFASGFGVSDSVSSLVSSNYFAGAFGFGSLTCSYSLSFRGYVFLFSLFIVVVFDCVFLLSSSFSFSCWLSLRVFVFDNSFFFSPSFCVSSWFSCFVLLFRQRSLSLALSLLLSVPVKGVVPRLL